jgi:hypothetical protein
VIEMGKERQAFDLMGDEAPEIIIEDTNGHSVYINANLLIKVISGVTAAIAAVVGVIFTV